MTLDGKIMTALQSISRAHQYSFANGTWRQISCSVSGANDLVDPLTLETDGTVLLVGAGSSILPSKQYYFIYSVETGREVGVTLPSFGTNGALYLPGRERYQAVWSHYLKKAVIYGGKDDADLTMLDQWVSVYEPVKKQWALLNTTGVNRKSTTGHCMAITDDGKTVFSYGGFPYLNATNIPLLSTLFILNLETNEWTKGAESNLPRANAACTVAGDYFLLWGGRILNNNNTSEVYDGDKNSTPVHIYQISKDEWVNEYHPPDKFRDPSAAVVSPSNGDQHPSGSGMAQKIAGIAGGAAGAVAVISMIVLLVWRRRKRTAKRLRQHGGSSPRIDNHNSMLDKVDNKSSGPKSFRSPQYGQNISHISVSDGVGYGLNSSRINGKENRMPAIIHGTPPPAPHYPSWGANFDGNYANHLTGHYARATEVAPDHTIESRMSPAQPSMFVTPPPSSPLSPKYQPTLPRPRNPQTLDHDPTLH
ncbi:hypothetical protein BGW42_005976 [Actinomortierella wolfii]|nr:hypothetical protein BGW42_005976 [Actinomortierella wolfii]